MSFLPHGGATDTEIRAFGSSLTALRAYRQAALTRPTQQCVGTRDLFWTLTGVPTMMKSLPVDQRTALSW